MLYIIDKNKFEGTIEAQMPDGVRTKYTKLTLNEFRNLKNNPDLITVTPEEFEIMRDKYTQSLITLLKEIGEDEFFEVFKNRKISNGTLEKGFAVFFFGEYNSLGVYDCYCIVKEKYYAGKKSMGVSRNELEKEVEILNNKRQTQQKVIVLGIGESSDNIQLHNYLEKFNINDVAELFDKDTCKIRIREKDYFFIKIDDDGVIIVIYMDVEYDIERKELETILFLFFSEGFTLHFEKKHSQWSEYTEGCIAFKEWGQSRFAIWQYTGELPKPKN